MKEEGINDVIEVVPDATLHLIDGAFWAGDKLLGFLRKANGKYYVTQAPWFQDVGFHNSTDELLAACIRSYDRWNREEIKRRMKQEREEDEQDCH